MSPGGGGSIAPRGKTVSPGGGGKTFAPGKKYRAPRGGGVGKKTNKDTRPGGKKAPRPPTQKKDTRPGEKKTPPTRTCAGGGPYRVCPRGGTIKEVPPRSGTNREELRVNKVGGVPRGVKTVRPRSGGI